MKRIQIVVIGLALATTSAAAQQAPATPGVAPEVQILQRRFQFQLMEGVIENAVQQGAIEVATRAQGVMPVGMLFIGNPKARGFPLDQYGVVFNVEIPQILESAVLLNQFQRPTLASPAQTGNQNVSNNAPGKTRAAGVVADDPMVKSPLVPDPFLADPNGFYRETVKGKLVDAILDFSKALDIPAGEYLSIVARGEDNPIRTSMYNDSKTMILRIKGSDLAMFYSGKITRDEARKLVIESQF
jgi:hypothetical protein